MVDGHLDDETYLLSLTRGGKGKFMSGRIYSIHAETTESFVETFDQLDFLGNQSIIFVSRYPASRLLEMLDLSEIQCYWLTNTQSTGALEPSNDSYAIAKIAGIKMCQAYRKQFGFNAVAVMPTNLYGPNDNFDHNYGHVLPSLIAKFHGSKEKSEHWVVKLWGDGSPKREFLHVDDLAEALNIIMERYDDEEIINVGTGEDITIKELAEMIVEVTGYKNEYEWDTSKPNGTLRKVLDVDKIKSLGWEPEIGLREGLESTYEWYKKSIGYEEVIHKVSPFRRFLNWMDQ